MGEVGRAEGLTSALGIGAKEHLVLVGGGGKTSLCFALAEALQRAGGHVITTTTTKVWQREAIRAPRVVYYASGLLPVDHVKEEIKATGHVFVGVRPLASGKVEGIPGETADLLFRDHEIDYVIAEADGAQGRPLKAPASHEPVIPSSATLVIAVIGLEALGKPLSPETVFRLEQFKAITDLDTRAMITPQALATLLHSPDGPFRGTPASARRIVFLNKSDLLSNEQDAVSLARLLTEVRCRAIRRVIIGSLLNRTYVTFD